MKNRKYQLFCMLLSGSMVVASPAAPVLAAVQTNNTAIVAEVQQENDEEWDDDALFDEYLLSLFYGSSPEISLFSNHTEKSTLNEDEKWLYDQLAAKIKEVAAGNLTSTEFTVNLDNPVSITASECGEEQFTYDKALTCLMEKLNSAYDISKVWNCLLADMPYDLYWHDKALEGGGIQYGYSDAAYSATEAHFSSITVKFAVNAKYAKTDGNQYDKYITNLDQADGNLARAQKAAAKAQRIVAENEDKSDYDKLYNYMKAICDLNTYNTAASGSPSNNTTDGIDPWQLIYVFDEDTNTNVVCEGYSKAFAYLCDLTTFQDSNIACYLVTGTMAGGTGAGGHMWNIVTMDDNRNYLVDVTNCDEGTIGSPDKLFLAGLPGSIDSYTFTADTNNVVMYSYDQNTKDLYGTGSDSILILFGQNYNKKELAKLTDEQLKSMVTIPADQPYTGLAVSATLTNAVSGTGTVTVYYQKSGSSEYSQEAPKDAGTYTVYLSVAAGTIYDYAEKTVVGSYTIKQAEITQAMFDDIADQPYTGQAIKPEVTSSKLVSGTDYMVGDYHNNISIASANQTSGPYVTVTGAGNYMGSVILPFSIVAPAIIGAVTISGTVECGQILTASAAVTTVDAGDVSYQWYRKDSDASDFSAINGATGGTYTLTAGDYGKKLKVVVTAENTTGQLEEETDTVKAGACPTENVPSDPVMDDIADTFAFAGKDGVAYECSLDGGTTWKDISTISGKGSISVGDMEIPAGQLQVRAKAVTGYKASSTISNSTAYTGKKDLAKAVISLSQDSFTYDGTEKKPNVTVTCDGQPVDASAYDVAISSTDTGTDSAGTNAGIVTLTVTAKSGTNYKGSTAITYLIDQATPTVTDVTCTTEKLLTSTKTSSVTLTGTSKCGDKVIEGTFTLTDAALSSGTKNYGWKFTPTDTRNYQEQTGTIVLTVQANTVKELTYTGTLEKASYEYGDALDLTGLIFTAEHQDGTKVTLSGSDLSYDRTLTVGQTKVEVSYTSDGTTVKTEVTGISVSGKQLVDTMISEIADQAYTGLAIQPEVIVKDGCTTLVKGTDYEVSYANNVNVAAADEENAPTVTIIGKGNYAGTVTKTFTIAQADSSGSSGTETGGGSGSSGTGTGGGSGAAGSESTSDSPSTGKETQQPEVTVNEDGSITTTTIETEADGSTTRTETTEKKDGSLQSITTTADSNGSVVSVTEKNVIPNVAKNTDLTVTVKKDQNGNISSAKAFITKMESDGKAVLKGSVIQTAVDTAGTPVSITMKVADKSGNTLYTVKTDSSKMTAGKKLFIMKVNEETGAYTMVDAKTYKVSQAGSVTVSMKDYGAYELVSASKAEKIEKEIKAAVKMKKYTATLKETGSTKAALATSLDMENVEKISYSSTNSKVAKVSKSGTVKAKGKGTAYIKAKVVLKNGSTKTVKMKITVK